MTATIKRREWGVRYEKPSEMLANGAIPTFTTIVNDQSLAEAAVAAGAPLSGKNHRVVTRLVSEWEEKKS